MKNMDTRSSGAHPCKPCPHSPCPIHSELLEIKALNHKIVAILNDQKKSNDTPILRDVEYLMDRAGISMRTVHRFQERGEIEVYERKRGKRYYRDEDVERLRQKYRG